MTMIKEILIFLAITFVTKLVNDNLPDLHRKNINKAFDKIWQWFPFLIFQLLVIACLKKLIRNDIAQKNLQFLKGLVWIEYMKKIN